MAVRRRQFVGLSIVGVISIVYYISTLQPTTLHLRFDDTSFVLDNHVHDRQTLIAKHTRRTDVNITTTRPNVQGGSKKPILVLTTRRSGSSFIGQLLNEHPDVAYLFEPLQVIKTNDSLADISLSSINSYIKKLFSCAFTDALRDVEELPVYERMLSIPACTIFLRHWKQGTHDYHCWTGHIKRVQFMCRHTRYVAIKVIRIYPAQLVLIKKFLQEEIQIVHLLRDPRGVISSRITIDQYKAKQQRSAYIRENFDVLVGKASYHCKRVRDALVRLASWKAADPSFNDFYHLVRYEDFAYHPEDMARALYSSLGMSLHNNVLAWLREATTKRNKAVGRNFYSTSRNSTQTAEAWRNKLPFYFVSAMQELPNCQYVMRRLGYESAKSQEMLRNSSLSLVRNI